MVWENKNVTTHMWVESQSAFWFCTKNLISKNNNSEYELDLMGTLGTLVCWTAAHETRLVMWYNKTFIVRPGSSPAWENFWEYTGCPRRNVPDFRRMFLKLKYTDITQNTYIQSWTVMEIIAREVWKYDSCYTLIDYQIHIKTGRNT